MGKKIQEEMRLITAEFFGTAFLTATVLILSGIFRGGTAPWYTAISAGATLAMLVGVFGNISGAHVNPAVTVGLWTLKKIKTTKALLYILSQLLGAAAMLALYNYVTDSRILSAGASGIDARVFVGEAVGAGIFGMGIIAAVHQKLEGFYKAFVIGASLTAGALFSLIATYPLLDRYPEILDYTTGFINPAVALGNNVWDKTVVIAPIVGMVVGMNIYHYAFVKYAGKGAKKK